MKFTSTSVSGAYLIELEKREDERGFLARTWDRREFEEHGIVLNLLEGYTCSTLKKGTVRGPHYVIPPHKEIKLTRVIRGSLYEVIVDLRPDSATYRKWMGMTMKASDYKMLVTPGGCAHAVLTLEDDTEYISYYAPPYDAAHERGIRFDDPAFNINWPIPVSSVSEKDRSWPDFKEARSMNYESGITNKYLDPNP